ncbi:hypothetical protein AMK32_31175 [Streptomyces sp. CB01883]|nr:hypothetical protein AMK32_31175 [Streptomyces sp. CB01883]
MPLAASDQYHELEGGSGHFGVRPRAARFGAGALTPAAASSSDASDSRHTRPIPAGSATAGRATRSTRPS